MAMQRAQEYISEQVYAYLKAAELRALEAEYARMTYNKQQDISWPIGQIEWGEERTGIRKYLKKIWMENVHTITVPNTLENARNEGKLILTWWWENRYQQTTPLDTGNTWFADFLARKYRERNGVNTDDNIHPGPR